MPQYIESLHDTGKVRSLQAFVWMPESGVWMRIESQHPPVVAGLVVLDDVELLLSPTIITSCTLHGVEALPCT
jgi:hypothetical protein